MNLAPMRSSCVDRSCLRASYSLPLDVAAPWTGGPVAVDGRAFGKLDPEDGSFKKLLDSAGRYTREFSDSASLTPASDSSRIRASRRTPWAATVSSACVIVAAICTSSSFLSCRPSCGIGFPTMAFSIYTVGLSSILYKYRLTGRRRGARTLLARPPAPLYGASASPTSPESSSRARNTNPLGPGVAPTHEGAYGDGALRRFASSDAACGLPRSSVP